MPDPRTAVANDHAAFRIRRAEAADADALLPLIHGHAAHEGGEASVDVASLRSVLDRAPSPLAAWVATWSGALIGYASATVDVSTWTGRPFLHLDCLFVGDGTRGCGVGSALLTTVRDHAAARGLAEVQWQTPAWNRDAARFYRRAGASMSPKMRFVLSSL